jgi:polysaccharide export outer membrane protein
MSKTLLIVIVALIGLPFLAIAQTQSQPQGGGNVGDFQANSGIDNQGIRRYRVGPGDLLDVRVFGQPDLNGQYEVDDDGNISSLPFIEDPIPAKCRNEKDIQKAITDAYSKYIVKPRVSVRVLERRSRQPAVVFGAVRMPSRVAMNRRLRLHEMLVTAGGVTQNASGTIDVLHTEPEMCPDPDEVPTTVPTATTVASNHSKESDVGRIETYKIAEMKTGAAEYDPYIRPGDYVIVNEGEPVFVTGVVFQPKELVIKDKLTLSQAIAMAGGPGKMANTSQIHIYRKKDGKIGSEDLKFDYDAIRKGKTDDVLLQAYDIIDVRAVGTFTGKGMGELLKSLGTGTLGALPMRIPY